MLSGFSFGCFCCFKSHYTVTTQKNNTDSFPTCGNFCAAKDTNIVWFRRVVAGPSLFCALWMEAWREYKKTFFLLRKERDRVMYTSGKEGKEGVRSNIQRESPGKREMWMVTAGLARSVDEEGGGRNLLYLHNSRLIYTHTPFPPPPLAPAWKRKKKRHTLFLSPGLTAEECCAAFKLPPKSLQIQQSAKFHTKQFSPCAAATYKNKCKNNDTRILLFLRGETENIVLAHVLPSF